MATKNTDWVGELVEKCVHENKLDLEKAKHLGEHNGIDLGHLKTDTGSDMARYRMTLSNMLRGRAKKRHVLKDHTGKKVAAPEDWVKDVCKGAEPTEDVNGNKIGKKEEKPAATEAKAPKAEGGKSKAA